MLPHCVFLPPPLTSANSACAWLPPPRFRACPAPPPTRPAGAATWALAPEPTQARDSRHCLRGKGRSPLLALLLLPPQFPLLLLLAPFQVPLPLSRAAFASFWRQQLPHLYRPYRLWQLLLPELPWLPLLGRGQEGRCLYTRTHAASPGARQGGECEGGRRSGERGSGGAGEQGMGAGSGGGSDGGGGQKREGRGSEVGGERRCILARSKQAPPCLQQVRGGGERMSGAGATASPSYAPSPPPFPLPSPRLLLR